MSKEIDLGKSGQSFLGTRFLGREQRARLERLLAETSGDVHIHFGPVGVTQSFLDEFIGVLVVKSGQSLVDRLVFRDCRPDSRALLELVIGARLDDHARLSAKSRAASTHYFPSAIRA